MTNHRSPTRPDSVISLPARVAGQRGEPAHGTPRCHDLDVLALSERFLELSALESRAPLGESASAMLARITGILVSLGGLAFASTAPKGEAQGIDDA